MSRPMRDPILLATNSAVICVSIGTSVHGKGSWDRSRAGQNVGNRGLGQVGGAP